MMILVNSQPDIIIILEDTSNCVLVKAKMLSDILCYNAITEYNSHCKNGKK